MPLASGNNLWLGATPILRAYLGGALLFDSAAPGGVWATVTATTGSPILHEDVDGDGLWDAYEWQASGSVTLTAGKIGRRLWQGGGASGARHAIAGGGGAGWTQQDNDHPDISADTYAVVIGAGALGQSPTNMSGADGSATTAMGVTAPGGGGGAGTGNSGDPTSGRPGGNGGGGATGNGDFANGGIGNPGFNGGEANAGRAAAGGGGSGGSGGAATTSFGQSGVAGLAVASTILGASRSFGRGGAGSGNAEIQVSDNEPAGSGNGSHGARSSQGNGGSGCFILRIRRA